MVSLETKNTLAEKIEIEKRVHEPHISMPFLEIHNFYEIYYLVKGERKYFIDDTTYQVKEGDVVIVRPDVLHRSIGDGDDIYTRILLRIPPHEIDSNILQKFDALSHIPIHNIPYKKRNFIEGLLNKTEYEYKRQDEFTDFVIRCQVNELLVFLMRLNKTTDILPSVLDSDRLINRATRFISEHYNEPLVLEEIAAYINISPTYFSKLFKKKMGFGFASYLTTIRITEAQKLLENTDMSVTEIALRCGYNNSSYFSAVFKQFHGVTPVKYRKLN